MRKGTADDMLAGGPNTYDIIRHDFMLSGDKQWNYDQHTFVGKALYPQELEWKKEIRKSHKLSVGAGAAASTTSVRYQLDVVKE